MPTTSHLYGQPDNEYEVFLPFAETLVKTSHRSGYKLHVTVTTQHHEQLAAGILPALRLLRTHHKVVLPGFYTNFNAGEQGGKFITVYAGPPDARVALSRRSIRCSQGCGAAASSLARPR